MFLDSVFNCTQFNNEFGKNVFSPRIRVICFAVLIFIIRITGMLLSLHAVKVMEIEK